jgi:excinuclease ABC subunit A
MNKIKLIGAREHNLKNIDVDIPKQQITVITGPSGSGKSSLAMDVLYAEGQRRYLESLSSYARQFLGMPQKPDVDRIDGLCPAIAIDQKTVGHNPRSTVGTITEMYDYLRVLFARIGTLYCPSCNGLVQSASPEMITDIIQQRYQGQTIHLAAPVIIEKKGEFVQELEQLFSAGYYRFIIDGAMVVLRSKDDIMELHLKKTYKHSIDVLIDTGKVTVEEATRTQEGVEKACSLAHGVCKVIVGDTSHYYSSSRMCMPCQRSFPEIEPRLFSFNSPLGACKQCHGLGVQSFFEAERFYYQEERSSLREQVCSGCKGRRLNESALAVKIVGNTIYEVGELSLDELHSFLKNLMLDDVQKVIAERLLAEIIARCGFLLDVGLGYLSLNRTARTLSGGEGQRVRLATQIGSPLSGVLYVLDEPSIGLHQRDNDRLLKTLQCLRDQGNTVVVVEHDTDTIRSADHVIDMGPAAGVLGGQVVATGTPDELMRQDASLTGNYLSGKYRIERSKVLRKPKGFITLNNATTHNLKDVQVRIPLGVLCGVSGVSGSGKSTLIMEELVPAVQKSLQHGSALRVSKIEGVEQLEAMVVIDQAPIGRTPRSNPATYLGIFDEIRRLFASLPESNVRGYTQGRFSFNVGEGRCGNCSGEGSITVAMHFLPDVTLSCNRCQGKRYNQQTLAITYKGKHIADVLAMTVREAVEFFKAHSLIAKKLKILNDVGLDYLTLGQSSTTLSGGEAQRIKLAYELAKRGSNTLYILDEPTTGLHQHDIAKLLRVFDALLDKGNSLVVIEHNLDVLKTADYLIDLGPEGGKHGGTIVATGTPQEVAACAQSFTGHYLKRIIAV